ncbi:hypothetical protein N7474_008815 [Penicillium riverlandense]|uniref:uncharacterized protein n=1 Tax=Penicillium riverlandense TaxID=1903569 RepID=UPI0025483B6F|nr:uncharacterized protein N7474_008815 [Penicillium riverlandense]KAJ5812514.1 hypothetical protein N7474_008815 [Penicillium riverlandense]
MADHELRPDAPSKLDEFPPPNRANTTPSYDSLQRHRRRNPRTRRPVKETLNARSEYTTSQDDGTAEHRINQYVIRQEIGRGSFGAVHLAVDQFGHEYAVKEFSKSRLRKRAQSHLLRRPRGPRRPSAGFNSPLHRNPSEDDAARAENPLYLIKEEIAIMKKLDHPNLVSLIEVLDDPTEDSLYMVMEMCKKGVIMKVGLDDKADPYDDEHCRCWFRDLILGIEYLHSQGIVHRDIKPDNCLLTNDDVLKVVDFGVSEMFEKDSDMFTAKSAGSPAFLPPELCVAKHGDVSGKAADIWSMGVTLYCIRYGRLPFEKESIFDLYESIRNDPVVYENEADESFKDMMEQILEKDPSKRIKMRDLRDHPWVTKNGTDLLLPWEENTAQIIEPPTEEEMDSAITRNMGRLMTVMKAVSNFRHLVHPTKSEPAMQSILGGDFDAHFVEPPMEMDSEEDFPAVGQPEPHHLKAAIRHSLPRHPMLSGTGDLSSTDQPPGSSDSTSVSSRPEHSPVSSQRPSGVFEPERKDSGSIRSGRPWEQILREARPSSQSASPRPPLSRTSSATTTTKRSLEGTRGHARDPLEEEYPYLFIGPSTYTGASSQEQCETVEADASAPIFEEPDSAMDSSRPVDIPTGEQPDEGPTVSESPGAAEFDIYETAYHTELERIKNRSNTVPTVYLTRRIKNQEALMKFVKEKSLDLKIGQKMAYPSSLSTPSAFTTAANVLRDQVSQKRQSSEPQRQPQLQPQHDSPEEDGPARREHQQQHHPPSASLSSRSIPDPEASSFEATGTSTTEAQLGGENSAAQLRRLLGRARDKPSDE